MVNIAQFAERIHIDLTDGVFAPSKLVEPDDAWWPVGMAADFHLMYKDPMPAAEIIMQHKPNLIIVHAEAEGDFNRFADFCRGHGVRVGVALLPQTPAETLLPALENIDHILLFSGNLGYQGGSHADLGLLHKLETLRRKKPALEAGWDGGVNMQNVSELAAGGIDVVNVGGFIQKAVNPAQAFTALQRIADETGTT